eukprot:GHVS01024446.1.p1 GENE.GHVS01024446.1~~GHVS01024446.1.p1  ORF type:complete len:153 (+),score=13.82 GHVS01024446.1:233-691(+)
MGLREDHGSNKRQTFRAMISHKQLLVSSPGISPPWCCGDITTPEYHHRSNRDEFFCRTQHAEMPFAAVRSHVAASRPPLACICRYNRMLQVVVVSFLQHGCYSTLYYCSRRWSLPSGTGAGAPPTALLPPALESVGGAGGATTRSATTRTIA